MQLESTSEPIVSAVTCAVAAGALALGVWIAASPMAGGHDLRMGAAPVLPEACASGEVCLTRASLGARVAAIEGRTP